MLVKIHMEVFVELSKYLLAEILNVGLDFPRVSLSSLYMLDYYCLFYGNHHFIYIFSSMGSSWTLTKPLFLLAKSLHR